MAAAASCVGTFLAVTALDLSSGGSNASTTGTFSFDSASGKLVSNATMNTTVLRDYLTTASAFERFVILVGGKVQDEDMVRYLITCYAAFVAVSLCVGGLLRVLVIRSGAQTTTGWLLELGNACCSASLLRTHPVLLRVLVWCIEFLVQTPHVAIITCSVHIFVLTGWVWAGLLCLSFGLGLTLTLTAFAVAFGGKCHCGPRQHKSIVLHLALGLVCVLMAWVGQVSSLMKGFYTAAAMALTLSSIPLILAIYIMAGQHQSHHFAQIMGTHFLSHAWSHAWRKNLQHTPVNEARSVFLEANCKEGDGGGTDDDEQEEAEDLYHNTKNNLPTEPDAQSVDSMAHAGAPLSQRAFMKLSTFSAVSALIHPYFDAETTVNLVDNITNTITTDDGGSADEYGNSSAGGPSSPRCAIRFARCCNVFYKCLCLCCFGNAGKKKKKRVASPRHAQQQQKGGIIWQLQALGIDANTVLYLVSAVIMLGYAIIIARQAAPGWGGFGYYTGIMTLVLDIPALAAFRIGLVESPGISTMLPRGQSLPDPAGEWRHGHVGRDSWICSLRRAVLLLQC